jgi:hypothetical protein
MKREGGEKGLADGLSCAQLPQSAIMPPIGEGGGAAWASLYISVLWWNSSLRTLLCSCWVSMPPTILMQIQSIVVCKSVETTEMIG